MVYTFAITATIEYAVTQTICSMARQQKTIEMRVEKATWPETLRAQRIRITDMEEMSRSEARDAQDNKGRRHKSHKGIPAGLQVRANRGSQIRVPIRPRQPERRGVVVRRVSERRRL